MIGLNPTRLEPADWPAEMTHVRLWDLQVAWRDIHVGPREYVWDRLDAAVEMAAGRHVLYTIGGCPRWLAKYPDQPHYAPWLGPGSNSMPHDMDQANEFFWHLATRYAGRINAYEVWNEPQLADFLYPWNAQERNALATMTRRAYNTVKACDPAALVLAAPVLPRASSGGMNRGRLYWEALEAKGWPVDAFTCHIYPEIGYWAPRWGSMLQDVVSTLGTYNPPTRKLWITETAYGLLGPETLPEQDTQAVEGTYKKDGGRFVYWYAPNRPDLGGMQVRTSPESAAWRAIKQYHNT